jgi:FkbM family methyltransferase
MTRGPKFNLLEMTLIAVPVLVLTYLVGGAQTRAKVLPYMSRDNMEVVALEKVYGPSRFSEGVEEWIIKDFFRGRRDGVFVDVGANHYQNGSMTYYLERELDWSGVAIEPQTKFAADYQAYRPQTTFVPLFVSDVSDRAHTFYVSEHDVISSDNREFTGSGGGKVTPSTVTTVTLDDVLDRLKIAHIDFLSMDIELHEPKALAGFSIDRFRPALVAIEAHKPVRQEILDYFARHHYVIVGDYWRADGHNLWFKPLP